MLDEPQEDADEAVAVDRTGLAILAMPHAGDDVEQSIEIELITARRVAGVAYEFVLFAGVRPTLDDDDVASKRQGIPLSSVIGDLPK
jgi:hypothetical protein